MRVAAAKLAASCVQPCSMQTSGTAVCGSHAGGWMHQCAPGLAGDRERPLVPRAGSRDRQAGSSPGAPARSITARLDA